MNPNPHTHQRHTFTPPTYSTTSSVGTFRKKDPIKKDNHSKINEKPQSRKSARTQGPFRAALIVLPVRALIDWYPMKCYSDSTPTPFGTVIKPIKNWQADWNKTHEVLLYMIKKINTHSLQRNKLCKPAHTKVPSSRHKHTPTHFIDKTSSTLKVK